MLFSCHSLYTLNRTDGKPNLAYVVRSRPSRSVLQDSAGATTQDLWQTQRVKTRFVARAELTAHLDDLSLNTYFPTRWGYLPSHSEHIFTAVRSTSLQSWANLHGSPDLCSCLCPYALIMTWITLIVCRRSAQYCYVLHSSKKIGALSDLTAKLSFQYCTKYCHSWSAASQSSQLSRKFCWLSRKQALQSRPVLGF